MTLPNSFLRLRDLNRASPRFSRQLAKMLDREEYAKCLPNLHGEDLVWLVEFLDRVSFLTTFPRSLPNAVVGSRRYPRSREPRIPEVPTRARKNMQCTRDTTGIMHAFSFPSGH